MASQTSSANHAAGAALLLVATLVLAACSPGGGTQPPGASPRQAQGTPAPAPTALLTVVGTGIGDTAPFTASGDHVTLRYEYGTCATGVVFAVSVVGTDAAGSNLAVAVVSGLTAPLGTATVPVALNGQPGPFHFSVYSNCRWALTISGRP